MPVGRHQAADRIIQRKLQLVRSPAWDDVRDAFLAKFKHCAACGGTQQLNVHHKFPFHYVVLCGRPDLELDPRNLITLCVRKDCEHHVLLGHLDDYESYNPRVLTFVKKYAGKSASEIRAADAFKQAKAAKPKHIDQMSQVEMDAFKKKLDRKFPPKAAIMAEALQARKTD